MGVFGKLRGFFERPPAQADAGRAPAAPSAPTGPPGVAVLLQGGFVFGDVDNGGGSALGELAERCPDVLAAWRASSTRVFVFEVYSGRDPWSNLQPDAATLARMHASATRGLARMAERARQWPGPGPNVFVAVTSQGASMHIARFGLSVPDGVFAGVFDVGEGGVSFHGADGTHVHSEAWDDARRWALGFLSRISA